MTTIETTVATTHVDLHGERMTVGALQSMVDAANESYIPVGVEHDPRVPPQGRIVRAWLENLDDGETAARAEMEFFEGPRGPRPIQDHREIRLRQFSGDKLQISFDRNFRDADDQFLLTQLSESLGADLREEFKKALDPISILTVGGVVALGAIAKGFLGKLGGDGYELLTKALKNLFAKQKDGEKERLLTLEFEVRHGDERFVVEVIASNPTASQIDRLLSVELHKLDDLVAKTFLPQTDVKKIVYEVKDEGIALKFAVRRDCVPLIPKPRDPAGGQDA